MVSSSTIAAINKVIRTYFDKHLTTTQVPAKDLMPQFIAAGIFPADIKKGLPIRNILRELDKTKQLHLIPHVLPERKQKNTNWFFVTKANGPTPSQQVSKTKNILPKQPTRLNSDEAYIIDLCDEILGEEALRQHKFDFLLGDRSSTGIQRKLPVDAYYPVLKLVVEYREEQHTKPVAYFDKPHIKTVSGVHRGEQRKLYDQRRRDVLPEHGIKLIEIQYDQLQHDNKGKLLRNRGVDIVIIKKILLS